ncbi:MAG: LysR family transcriptional regulator [Limimaricola sp.]|uniref:LysR family transcriptional regulator n=1 Tax=Limimaricola sp. TaxID=2211665 RepID=UPI001DE953EE|nr:LysR family transcriptional regulator [Limimaricola sp.]MBI1416414.1 LysR family transcriptional regulator [Limimaricola sp.]
MVQKSIDSVDFRLLQVFVAVVEAGGFAAAEVTLNLGLSTISAHMKALETRLGLTLCQRGRAGFALTEPGAAVYAEARQLISAGEGFAARVAGLRSRLAGPVRLGLLDAIIGDPAARITEGLAVFARAAPEAEIRLIRRPPDELLRDVAGRALDIAVGSFPRVAVGLDYIDLYQERHAFYCGKGHPLHDLPDAEITPDTIRRHRLIGRSYWAARDLSAFAGERVGAVVADMESAALLILTGAFLGYLPEHYAAPYVAAGRMRALAPDRFGYVAQFQLAYLQDRLEVPRIAALVEALRRAHGRG